MECFRKRGEKCAIDRANRWPPASETQGRVTWEHHTRVNRANGKREREQEEEQQKDNREKERQLQADADREKGREETKQAIREQKRRRHC